MYTAEAEPIVTCIIDEAILELLQVAFFVKKEAIESVRVQRAASCLSHAAACRRAGQLLAGRAEPHGAVPVSVSK